jgi:hypothetical protein
LARTTKRISPSQRIIVYGLANAVTMIDGALARAN